MPERCPVCHRAMPKPLPKRRAKPRRGPMRDPGYRRWLRNRWCVVDIQDVRTTECDYGAHHQSDPAHTQNNGLSSKGPDSSCVPLCRAHHREFDAGRAAFERKYNVNMKKLAAEHYARYLKEMEDAAKE